MVSLFLFHRDLRLYDNSGLIEAAKNSKTVYPLFIFDNIQIDKSKNRYFSNRSVEFMCQSLKSLDKSLKGKLNIIKGDIIESLEAVYKVNKFSSLYTNSDYTPYSVKRDKLIKEWCESKNITFVGVEDYDIISINEGLLKTGEVYKVFTPYMRNLLKTYKIRQPNEYKFKTVLFKKINIEKIGLDQFYEKTINSLGIVGGREEAFNRLEFVKSLVDYTDKRDYPALDKTSRLSPFIKFGCISVREVWWFIVKHLGQKSGILRELIFRSFYAHITYHIPSIVIDSLHPNVDKLIKWNYDKTVLEKFETGNTGVPMVDAGIRQLLTDGWVHNRVRMIIASFGCKNLLLDWRELARWFGCNLVDLDLSSNIHGWLWANSLGTDAVPYFRYPFNPYTQSKKFDIDCIYIKKYVKELENVNNADIHKWDSPKIRSKYNINYEPIIDVKKSSKEAVKIYTDAFVKSR